MEENISEWKYPKLLNRAKELGIVFDNPKPKKSIVVEAIEAQMRIQQATMDLVMPQTPEPPPPKKKAAGKKTRGGRAKADEMVAAADEEPEAPAKKAKKKTAKAKKSGDVVESTPAKRATRGASHAVYVEEEEEDEEKPAARAGRKKKATAKEPEAAEIPEEPVKPTKKTKKAKKLAAANETFSAAQVLEAIVAATESSQPKTPRKSVCFSRSVTERDDQEEKDTSGKDLALRLDEDSNDAPQLVARADATVVKHKLPADASAALLTDDDDNDEPVVKSKRNTPVKPARSVSADSRVISNNRTLDITNDLSSATFNKTPCKPGGEVAVPCSAFYNVPAVAAEEAKPAILLQPPISEPQGAAKPKAGGGGARIVRPKQLVSEAVDQDVVAIAPAEADVPSKKLEIVQREAGPRIVKPKVLAENEAVASKAAASDHKLKKRVASADQVALKTLRMPPTSASPAVAEKKTLQRKPSVTVPDFKAIHEKEAKKMLSLEEHQQKKNERKDKLMAKPAEAPKSKLKTPSRVLVKPVVSKTPSSALKPAKTPGSTKLVKPAKIVKPVVVNDENNPTTPVMSGRRVSSFNSAAKTPTSTVKPSASALNASATKKSTHFVFGANGGPSASSLLATSSFNRRKSYDPNASQCRPLGYKPHEGMLKPIDFNAKSIFLNQLKEPLLLRPAPPASNVTSTITAAADTTVVIDKKSSTPKASAPGQAKRRPSNLLLSSIRPAPSVSMVTSTLTNGSKTHLLKQSVRQHSKKATEQFRLNESNLRLENRKSTVDKSRQLAVNTAAI